MAAAHVQQVISESFGAITTIAITVNGVATGNAICGQVVWNSGTVTLDSVTDTGSNTYVRLNNPVTSGSQRAALFYALNVTGGNLTITATFSAATANGWNALIVHEASGIATTGALDGNALNAQTNPGTGTDAITSTSITTAANGDYLGAFVMEMPHKNSGGTYTAGTGYTQRVNSLNAGSESQIQATAGAIAGTFTGSATFAVTACGVIALQAVATVTSVPFQGNRLRPRVFAPGLAR